MTFFFFFEEGLHLACGTYSTMKSKFHKDICVAKVNLGHVTSLQWNMLSLCCTRVKHICVSGKHKLQVVCVPNGKVCFKWTACRFGNWILPSSITRQICKAIVRWQGCSNWVPLVAHNTGLCVREHRTNGKELCFSTGTFYICIPIRNEPSQHISYSALKTVFAELV